MGIANVFPGYADKRCRLIGGRKIAGVLLYYQGVYRGMYLHKKVRLPLLAEAAVGEGKYREEASPNTNITYLYIGY